MPVGNRFTYAFGRFCDGASEFVTRLFHLHRPSCTRYESVFAAAMEEAGLQFKRLTRSISFGLIMFCLGCSSRWPICCGCNETYRSGPAALLPPGRFLP